MAAIISRSEGNNPHPARGRKHGRARMRLPLRRNNPHPARGRKPLMARGAACTLMKQPTPRKGTETPDSPWRRQRPDGNNPRPARGRKLPVFTPLFAPFFETTHTPQGDGNLDLRRAAHPVHETTHTPQGDGNRSYASNSPLLSRNNPHPARGRKLDSVTGVGIL